MLTFIIIGLVAGVLAGIFGIGGGIVIVPALAQFAKMPFKMATGTSLGALLLPVGLLGAISYYRSGNLDPRAALLIAAGIVFGAYAGARLAEVELRAGWSPQQYCGRIRLLDALLGFRGQAASLISHETIYNAIFDLPRGPQRHDLTCLLRQSPAGRRRRVRRRAAKRSSSPLQNIVSIDARPADVLSRLTAGHWEGDLIKGANGKSFVGTLVERHSRVTILVKLRNGTAGEVYRAFLRRLQALPATLRLSLTYDRGSEMALHQRLSRRLNMPVFFCHPYSPWQRPSNENTNGLVRQYLPKGMDLSLLTATQLQAIEAALNNRPRRVLGYRTPAEVLGAVSAQPR